MHAVMYWMCDHHNHVSANTVTGWWREFIIVMFTISKYFCSIVKGLIYKCWLNVIGEAGYLPLTCRWFPLKPRHDKPVALLVYDVIIFLLEVTNTITQKTSDCIPVRWNIWVGCRLMCHLCLLHWLTSLEIISQVKAWLFTAPSVFE